MKPTCDSSMGRSRSTGTAEDISSMLPRLQTLYERPLRFPNCVSSRPSSDSGFVRGTAGANLSRKSRAESSRSRLAGNGNHETICDQKYEHATDRHQHGLPVESRDVPAEERVANQSTDRRPDDADQYGDRQSFEVCRLPGIVRCATWCLICSITRGVV